MLTIRTAKEYKDFGKKVASTKIFETQKSTIDMANGLDEMIDDINSDGEYSIITLSSFVLSRIGTLIRSRYINHRNVKIKFYNESGNIEEYTYKSDGSLVGLNLSIYSPSVKPIKFK